MNQTQKTFGILCALVVSAAPAAQGQGSCEQIRAACQSAGFVRGAADLGIGLQVDCIVPIVRGTAQRPRARKPLPQVNPQLIMECAATHPNFGRPNPPPAETISQPFGARPLQPGLSYPNDTPRRRYDSGAGAPPRPSIPLPEAELLERQVAPDCEFKSTAQADDEAALRTIKLDFEQQCYRQSELILRARMERLQDAVSKMIESINRRDRSSER